MRTPLSDETCTSYFEDIQSSFKKENKEVKEYDNIQHLLRESLMARSGYCWFKIQSFFPK